MLVEFGVRLLNETNNATKTFVNMSSQETVNKYNQENITHARGTKVLLVQVNCALNVLLALTAIAGNSLVLHVARKSKTLRSPSTFLLCGLAMSDLPLAQSHSHFSSQTI